jgi:hypothetical protein
MPVQDGEQDEHGTDGQGHGPFPPQKEARNTCPGREGHGTANPAAHATEQAVGLLGLGGPGSSLGLIPRRVGRARCDGQLSAAGTDGGPAGIFFGDVEPLAALRAGNADHDWHPFWPGRAQQGRCEKRQQGRHGSGRSPSVRSGAGRVRVGAVGSASTEQRQLPAPPCAELEKNLEVTCNHRANPGRGWREPGTAGRQRVADNLFVEAASPGEGFPVTAGATGRGLIQSSTNEGQSRTLSSIIGGPL